MELDKLEDTLSDLGAVFLLYGGELSQNLLSSLTVTLEEEMKKKHISMSSSVKIFTIFIELSQSIIDYSKQHNFSEKNSLIYIGNRNNEEYYVKAKSVIFKEHKEFLEQVFNRLNQLSEQEQKTFYREFRKTIDLERFENRVVISFLEIIKKSEKFEFKFTSLDEKKFNFIFTSYIKNQEKVQ